MKFYAVTIGTDKSMKKTWMNTDDVAKALIADKDEGKILHIYRTSNDQVAKLDGESVVWVDIKVEL